MTDRIEERYETDDAHPVGTTLGATTGVVGGGALGAALGGPVGAVLGAILGGVGGGKAGHEIAESLEDPTGEDDYWRENYRRRPYVGDEKYETFRPAYYYGWNARRRTLGTTWDEVEHELREGWESFEDRTGLAWDRASGAVRDAWDRIERTFENVFRDEDEHWRTNFRSRPYVDDDVSYETLRPAYEYGWRERVRRWDARWEDVEDDLEETWDRVMDSAKLKWHQVKDAVRDAWHHVERKLPGDFDLDGR